MMGRVVADISTPPYHAALVAHAAHALRSHPLGNLLARHRLNDIRAGHISRGGWLDNLASGARKDVLGGLVDALRAVIVIGDVSYAAASRSHAVLALPLTRITISPYAAGPVFASHFYDLQSPVVPDVFAPSPKTGVKAHTGAPGNNVEIVLRGISEPMAEEGEVAGHVWVRGPSVLDRQGSKEGWSDAAFSAVVAPNGTFTVV